MRDFSRREIRHYPAEPLIPRQIRLPALSAPEVIRFVRMLRKFPGIPQHAPWLFYMLNFLNQNAHRQLALSPDTVSGTIKQERFFRSCPFRIFICFTPDSLRFQRSLV